MIDIHAHALPFVDDGSEGLEQSLKLIEEEVALGVTDVVLTPHYRFDFKPDKAQIERAFESLKTQLVAKGVKINLYLGQEIFIDKDFKKLLTEKLVQTLNGSKYLLVEFDFELNRSISETVYELVLMGYIPIVAHVERYFYADVVECLRIKRLGGMLQVNAGSIVGKGKRKSRRLIKRLFKLGLVDFVASDVHARRANLMGEAYDWVSKKYGKDTAERVFVENALNILKG